VNASLRTAAEADAPRIAEILIVGRSTFMPYAPSVHTEGELGQWVQAVLLPAGGVTVAEQTGVIVGFVALSQDSGCSWQDSGCSWIDQMFVHRSHVGKGVGTQLLAHALNTLPAPVRLYTFQENTGARRFYERHGFVAVQLTDGQANEEHCPDVLYERPAASQTGG